MKNKHLVLWCAALILAVLTTPLAARADVFMKQKQHTDGYQMMGKTMPAKDRIQTIWITPDKIRSDNDEQSMLILLDKNVMYMMDHAKKTIMEMPLDFGKSMPGMQTSKGEGDTESENAMQAMMQSMMKMKLSISATGEKRVINGWSCKKYIQKLDMTMGPSSSEIWATEDLKIDPQLYAKFSTAMFGMQPGMKNMMSEMMKEHQKIKGVAVLTTSTTTIMNTSMKSSTELLEFKEGKPPAGIFELPTGYKKSAFPGMEE